MYMKRIAVQMFTFGMSKNNMQDEHLSRRIQRGATSSASGISTNCTTARRPALLCIATYILQMLIQPQISAQKLIAN